MPLAWALPHPLATAMKPARALLPLVLLLALGAPAFAGQGWVTALRGSVVQDFNDEELRQMLGAIRRQLDAPLPAAPLDWNSPDSGAGVHIEVSGSPRIAGFENCRSLRLAAHSKKRKGETVAFTACQVPGGNWKVVDRPPAARKAQR